MLFCSDLERQVDAHESQLVEIDQQQKHLLANVRKETELLEEQRKMLSDELGKASNKLSVTAIFDFLGETESEGESLSEQTRTCSELEASLSRLALLDKTQQEIDQISVATETMLQQSKKFSFL